jgi:MFS family permease
MDETTATTKLWRNRNYVYFRTSRTVSNLGSGMTGLAGPLLVLSMGGGAVRAGAVGTCWFLTQLVFQLPAGYLADRFDRRRLMLWMDVVRLVAIGSIPLTAVLGWLTFGQLMAVVFVEGAATVVFSSASMVFLRAVVPPELFSRAMSQSQFSGGAVSVLAPLIGGALFGVDRLLPFTVDAGTYIVSVVLLYGVSVRLKSPADGEPADGTPADRRATAGLRWLWRRQGILRQVLFCTVLNLVSAAMGLAALVVLTQRGTPAGVIGIVLGWSGGGVIVGSLVATRAMRLGRWLFPLIGILWTVCLASVALSASAWVVGVVLTFLAFLAPWMGVALFQTLRDEAPMDLFGRVVAAQQLLGGSLAVAAPLLTGVLLAAVGGTDVWLVLAGTCLVATAITLWPRPAARAAVATPAPEPATATATATATGRG